MSIQTRATNAFALRSFLSLVGGVVLFQVGSTLGKGSSYQVNWYFIALCAVYALIPIAILRAIRRRPNFSRRLYSIILGVLALLAVVGGIAVSLIPFSGP
jgi:glucan phosphoethanolaminetransferase (alkaline phosphatase superfamily)